jgi:hypothetical protein
MKGLSSKIKVKKRKTLKKSNDMSKRKYLEFLKKREKSKSKTPVDNIVQKNVELMEQNIAPQNIHDVDKTLKQSTVNRVKLLKQPEIDIKMPKSVETDRNKNIKSVFVEEELSQPKFVFDRSKSTDKSKDKVVSKPKKKNKKKSEMKKSEMKKSEMKKSKKKNIKRKSRKVSFTVKKPKKSDCDKFKQQTEEIDKKDDVEIDTILKDKGIKTTGKNGKLKRDLLKISDKINIKKE